MFFAGDKGLLLLLQWDGSIFLLYFDETGSGGGANSVKNAMLLVNETVEAFESCQT